MPFKNKEDKANYNKNYYSSITKKKNTTRPKNPVLPKDEYCSQCKLYFTRGYMSKHLKTKKHKDKVAELIKQQNNS